MTAFAPKEIIASPMTRVASPPLVPLVTTLGVGLASSSKGRNPVVDGVGLIAFASITPMIFVTDTG